VDPLAIVHPTAKIGPNVYIGPNSVIGKGVRIANSIVQANVQVKDHACILYSIVSCDIAVLFSLIVPVDSRVLARNDCFVGQWTRLEGIPEAVAATIGGHDARHKRMGITIFGDGVTANPEIVVRNCIVMSHKNISSSTSNEILL